MKSHKFECKTSDDRFSNGSFESFRTRNRTCILFTANDSSNLLSQNNQNNNRGNGVENSLHSNSLLSPHIEILEESKQQIDNNADLNAINAVILDGNIRSNTNENGLVIHPINPQENPPENEEEEEESIIIYNWVSLKYWNQLKTKSKNLVEYFSNKFQLRFVHIYNIILYALASALITYICLTVQIFGLQLIFGITELCTMTGLIFIEIVFLYLKCKNLNQPGCWKYLKLIIALSYHAILMAAIYITFFLNKIQSIFLFVIFCLFWVLQILNAFYIILLVFCLIIFIPVEFVVRFVSCKLLKPCYIIWPNSALNLRGKIPENAKQFEYNSTLFKLNKCIICMELFHNKSKIYVLKCHETHIFHVNCLKEWVKRKYECPNCRGFLQFQSE